MTCFGPLKGKVPSYHYSKIFSSNTLAPHSNLAVVPAACYCPSWQRATSSKGSITLKRCCKLCREQAGELDPALDPVLHQASIEDFQAGAVYGSIIIPAFTLQLVSPEKISASLLNIHQHLHPGGGLYLTLFIPWAEITGDLEEGSWFLDQEAAMRDGNLARCHTRFEIKRLSQQLTRDHRYEIVSQEKGIIETSTSTQQLNWYWRREIEMLLHHAGFSIQEIIGDFIAGCAL